MHINKMAKPKRSIFYDTYWQFAAKRFDVFERRLKNQPAPWTSDPVIANNRFTNVFRASDRVSQYLINLQYENDDLQDVFFKTILFKLFNKIETYTFLDKELAVISAETFSFDKYDRLLTQRLSAVRSILQPISFHLQGVPLVINLSTLTTWLY